jgi:ABC-type glutathione transport system ATPase component
VLFITHDMGVVAEIADQRRRHAARSSSSSKDRPAGCVAQSDRSTITPATLLSTVPSLARALRAEASTKEPVVLDTRPA